jgi:uncharacterized YigZ family protein
MTESYLSISKNGQGLYKEKGSKFISFSLSVTSEEEINSQLEILKKQYHDARHLCYAWRLGAEKVHYRFNDDGEPTNSAGKPILGQIESKDLTNILVVVVRYFGGVKLGVGGLIQAYKSAAKEAIENARIVEKFVFCHYYLSFDYLSMNNVMKILKELEAEQYEQDFNINCNMKIKIKASLRIRFEDVWQVYPEIKFKYLYDN